jgi:hypothetical protein
MAEAQRARRREGAEPVDDIVQVLLFVVDPVLGVHECQEPSLARIQCLDARQRWGWEKRYSGPWTMNPESMGTLQDEASVCTIFSSIEMVTTPSRLSR